MANGYIQLPTDGTGKKTRMTTVDIDGSTVHQQVIQNADSSDTIINPATSDKQLPDGHNVVVANTSSNPIPVTDSTMDNLIYTLQELNQRLAFLGSIKQHQTESLRVTAVTGSTTAVSSGTITTVSTLTNFGTGVSAWMVAMAIANQTAIQSNINNVSVN